MNAAAALLVLLAVQPKTSPPSPHFPDRLHAFVWRNWELVPADRLAGVLGAKAADVVALGKAMGLPDPPAITDDQRRRSYITVIRRNWHLLPTDQLLRLLGWTAEHLEFTLREDDFLLVKLGGSKPPCEPLAWAPPDPKAAARIAEVVQREFPGGLPVQDPPFAFVSRLSAPAAAAPPAESRFAPRFCYSYFALYGDPLLEPEADPYPDGLLTRLAQSGVDGVWLQGVLHKLASFPWDPKQSERFEERRKGLNALVARARKHGIGIYLYLNEPRAWPQAFYASRSGLKGVSEGTHATLCTSHPEVQKYLTDSVASLCRDVPDLAGLFTITASENLTSCWSHRKGKDCGRCSKRSEGEVIAEVNRLIDAGIRAAGSKTRLLCWDWGWPDAAAAEIIGGLPDACSFMSVSEWSLPIERGGVKTAVGEYSISAVGPGPRARRHWELARKRGLKTIAKVQAGNTWELSAVPWIPAVENVAQHAANLRKEGVDGLMLGWTLGGHPSPNLEVVAEIGRSADVTPDEAMKRVAVRRYGADKADEVVRAWKECSAAFREFAYHIETVYRAPLQMGPANPLWEAPTGWKSTMVGFPYDDLDGWRGPYPPHDFALQMQKVAHGFGAAADRLLFAGLEEEARIAQACALHFRSVSLQTMFLTTRALLVDTPDLERGQLLLANLQHLIEEEVKAAKKLFALRAADSRIGFEASNHYYYMPFDLVEKVLNCRDLLDRWIPAQRARLK